MADSSNLGSLFGEDSYEALVKGIRDFAVIHFDLGANVQSWNKGAEAIFGFTESEILGQSISVIFTDEDRRLGVPERELKKAADEGRAEDVRWHRRKDGSAVYLNGATSGIKDKSGALRGFVKIGRDNTQRKQIEDDLARVNARNSAILESITDAFFALDSHWRFTYVNKQSEPLFRRSSSELLGKSVWDEMPEAVGSTFERQYRKAVSEQISITFEEYYPPLDTWFEVRAYPSADGGLSVYFHNINERVERRRLDRLNSRISHSLVQIVSLQDLLQQCTRLMVEHLNVSFALIWTLNPADNMLELRASAAMDTHLEGPHASVPVGKLKIAAIAESRRPHVTNDVVNDPLISGRDWAESAGITAFAGYPLIVSDRLIGVMCVFSKSKLSEGTLSAIASVSDGIANGIEKKHIENALLQSEEQYRLVAESASDAIITIDERSTILYINRAAGRIFGYEADEMLGKNLTMLMPEYLRELHLAGQRRYLETGKKHLEWDRVEVPGRHQTGAEFPLEISFGEYKKNGKRVFIGVIRDVSQRKRAEDALRESEEKFSMLAESVPQLVWMAESDGSVFWYNQNWFDYTGTSPEQMKGWGWQSVHDPEMLPAVKERWMESIKTGRRFEMEFPLRGRDGRFRWFLTRVNPGRDADGRIVRWFGTNTDVDEQRRLDMRNRFVLQLDESVRALESPEEISLKLARLLGEYLGVDRCAYAEVEPDEDHFYIPGDYTREGVESIVGRYSMSQFGAEVLRLMRANEPYTVNNVLTDERVTKADLAAYEQTTIQAVICVPLHKNGRFAACMAVHQRVPRVWRPEEIELVSFVSNRFWESIERARVVKSLHEALAREQQARQSAETASKVKDEFLATISHELRTPLNAVLGWASMLRSGILSGEASERAVETLERNARSQAQLIDDLLDVSRIISGKLRLDVHDVDLSAVIESALESVRPAADAKGVQLQVLIDPNVGPISGDAGRLQQVFWNLLSNAVKFTPKGGRVKVKLERVNSHIEATVADTGKGIEADFLPYIFDRFRQADQSTTRRQGGLGLGLSIVRQLVEMHGGAVSAESGGEGMGTTFVVTLPGLAAAPHRRGTETRREHSAASGNFVPLESAPELNGLRILVVDDEADTRDLLRTVLEMRGGAVITAGTAAEALAAFENSEFDILISDIGMPYEDGYALIEKVRSLPDETARRIPAVALTAYARIEDRVRVLAAGFQVHLPKPVEPAELAAVVASLAKKSSGKI